MSEVRTAEEIREAIHNPDPEIAAAAIREYMENPVVAVPQEIEEEQVPDMVQSIPENTDIPYQEEEKIEDDNAVEPLDEEKEAAIRYRKHLEEQLKEKEEQLKQESAEAARLRKEAEDKQRLLDEAKHRLANPVVTDNQSPTTVLDDEDSEYATPYEKNTRRILEEKLAKLGSLDPEVMEIKQYLRDQKEKDAIREQREKEEQKRKQAEEINRKLYDNVSQFQSKHSEFVTPEPIDRMNKKFSTFRGQLANVMAVDPNNEEAVNVLESKYFKRYDNGEVFKQMEARGIKPPEGTDVFRKIVEYNELREGYKTDDMTGKKIPIVDDFGTPVRYGSIEEAYRVKNYETLEAEALKRASVEIQDKLKQRNQSAITLDNSNISPIGGTMTESEVDYYFNMSNVNEIRKLSPDEYSKWQESFRIKGGTPPKVPGR